MTTATATSATLLRAVLFDVDGTLIRAGGSGREALARAATRHFQIPADVSRTRIREIDFRGATDALILEQFGELLGVSMAGDPEYQRVYLQELERVLDSVEIEIMPGVIDALDELRRRSDVTLGLLTGNVREGARQKLGRVGMTYLLDGPGAFGEAGRERVELARVAVERVEELGGAAEHTVVIGDTPIDVQVARACGARAVAVATGWTPYEELADSGADLVLHDLADPAPLWRLLESL